MGDEQGAVGECGDVVGPAAQVLRGRSDRAPGPVCGSYAAPSWSGVPSWPRPTRCRPGLR